MRLSFVAIVLVLCSACDPAASVDGGNVRDVPSILDGGFDGGGDLDGGDLDGGDLDGGGDLDAIRTDAGTTSDGGITAEQYCERLVACAAGTTLAGCIEVFEAELARVEPLGCGDEASAANGCTAEIFVPGPDGGVCTPSLEPCDAVYTAYNQCVVAATGVEAFSCDAGFVCITTEGSATAPERGCPAAIGELVDSCPSGGEVGRCVREVSGDVTQTAIYYAPLPPGVTLETVEASCVAPAGGAVGVWSVP